MDFDELVRVLDALSSLVRNCYGPCAEEALLFAPPDLPVVTADGHAMLMAWRRGLRENSASREPMQMFVLDAAESLYLQIGDSTSEFVLLLHGAVKHAMDVIRQTRSQWHAEINFRQLATAFGELKRECEQLLIEYSEWRPDLRVATPISFDYHCGGELRPSQEVPLVYFHNAAMDILRSGLSGLPGEQALEFLSRLVVEWLFTSPIVTRCEDHKVDAQLLFKRVNQFLKRAPDMITFALASSVFGSQVVLSDQFILRKSLVPSQLPSMLQSTNADSPLRFVCLTCELSLTSGTNHVTIRTETSDDLFSTADATRRFITKYLNALRNVHNIRLLVCTEQVEDAVAAICTRLGLAYVQCAEKSDVFDLCAAAQVYPLASLLDVIHENLHIGICSEGATSVRLQQSANLWFHGLSQAKSDREDTQVDPRAHVVVVPQLLLKAPTKGVYKQYHKVVVKALRVLRSWWEPSVQVPTSSPQQQSHQFELYSCRGGGATELAIARHLDERANPGSVFSNGDSTATRLARTIFANALRDVVVILKGNMSAMAASSSSSDERCADDDVHTSRVSKRIILQDMARMVLRDAVPLHGYVLNASHTIETMAGPICVPELIFGDPREFGLLHPFRMIDALLFHVLQTLEQLFRVDCVLHTSHKVREADEAAA